MSSNDKRRHMKLGQRAMVAAKVRKVTEKLSLRETAKIAKVDRETQRQAALVLQYRPDLADDVILGNKPLNEAYTLAQDRKAEMESDQFKTERLRKYAIDLADLVAEERMTLAEGLAIARFRSQARA